jgi:hypothetical protein
MESGRYDERVAMDARGVSKWWNEIIDKILRCQRIIARHRYLAALFFPSWSDWTCALLTVTWEGEMTTACLCFLHLPSDRVMTDNDVSHDIQ